MRENPTIKNMLTLTKESCNITAQILGLKILSKIISDFDFNCWNRLMGQFAARIHEGYMPANISKYAFQSIAVR